MQRILNSDRDKIQENHMGNHPKQLIVKSLFVCKISIPQFTYSANVRNTRKEEVIVLEMGNNLKLHFKPKLSIPLALDKPRKILLFAMSV